MIDSDYFEQWIVVPNDRPALPPVDEDMCLKDFSSLETPSDLHIDRGYGEPSGLLLGSDLCGHPGVDTFDAITLPYEAPLDAERHMFPTSDSSPSQISYANIFLPALSPDASPTSVMSSTPWLRTPEADPSFTHIMSVDALQDITETKEPCSMVHFLDQAGNHLEDAPSQIQDVMPEDIACSPLVIPDASPLSLPSNVPCGGLGSVPPTPRSPAVFVVPLPCALTPQTEVVSHGPGHYTQLFRSSPHISHSLLTPSLATCQVREAPLPGCSTSPSLSPLSTLSLLSQSPDASPYPMAPIGCASLSPATLPLPFSDGGGRVEMTGSDPSMFKRVTLTTLRGKRNGGSLGDGVPPWKIPRRTKAKNTDEEEWCPLARVKHARAMASSQSTRQTASVADCPQDGSSSQQTDHGTDPDTSHTSCEICGQQFTRPSDYIRHIENSASHPETRKMWPCPYCDSTLGRKDALGRHIKTMHPSRPVSISEGVLGSQLVEGQKEPSVHRMGQKKTPQRGRSRKDARRYR